MNKININHLKDGSTRFITMLTPDTFLRKIIVISTLTTQDGTGQTAITQTDVLNCKWKILKEHKTIEEAINYHITLINKKNFGDCTMSDGE